LYGCIVTWFYGYMVVLLHGCIVTWLYGYMVVLLHGCMVVLSHGSMVTWLYCYMVVWLHGCMVTWLYCYMVYGCMVTLLLLQGALHGYKGLVHGYMFPSVHGTLLHVCMVTLLSCYMVLWLHGYCYKDHYTVTGFHGTLLHGTKR